MGLATSVLKRCVLDLMFFGLVFAISVLAFSSMFFITLGPVVEKFSAPGTAFVSLFRSLFGDFDMDDILANSSGYFNVMLYLCYLFIWTAPSMLRWDLSGTVLC